ncbi:MAG: hypothetical protein ACE5OP_02265 [Candidatus Glassbacteria bacterium]
MNRYIRRYREIQKKGLSDTRKIVRFAVLLFFLLVALTFYSVWSRSFVMQLAGEMEVIRGRILELSAEIDLLQKKINARASRASIVKRSRETLGMVFPRQDDVYFVVIDSSMIDEDNRR